MGKLFQNILKLSIGDLFGKIFNFIALIYLARVLGVTSYGTFEFALTILTYFTLLADGGLEFWSTREVAHTGDVRQLVQRIVPLRLILASTAFLILLIILPAFPTYPNLRPLLILFGLTLIATAFNLKWVFIGKEMMSRVAFGIMISQLVILLSSISLVHTPEQVLWVPVIWLVSDITIILYFWWHFATSFAGLHLRFTIRGTARVLKPAFTIGAAQAMGLMSYNFDTLLIGFLLGATSVGWYKAAYKPITAALAIPLTYFVGLFPALARTYGENRQEFEAIIQRSLRVTAIFALPLGVGGTFFAAPIISILFGPEYANSIPAMQLLSWSATLIILRDTFRQGLIASGNQGLDLTSAGAAVFFNVILNIILIPRFGILGAATATIISEVVWLICFHIFFLAKSNSFVALFLFSASPDRCHSHGYLLLSDDPAFLAHECSSWNPGLFWLFNNY